MERVLNWLKHFIGCKYGGSAIDYDENQSTSPHKSGLRGLAKKAWKSGLSSPNVVESP